SRASCRGRRGQRGRSWSARSSGLGCAPSCATQRLSQRAWAWLDTARDQLALPTGIPPCELDQGRHLKPVIELALAGSIAIREGASGSQSAQIASSLVEFAWKQLDSGELLYQLQREHPGELYSATALRGVTHPVSA